MSFRDKYQSRERERMTINRAVEILSKGFELKYKGRLEDFWEKEDSKKALEHLRQYPLNQRKIFLGQEEIYSFIQKRIHEIESQKRISKPKSPITQSKLLKDLETRYF